MTEVAFATSRFLCMGLPTSSRVQHCSYIGAQGIFAHPVYRRYFFLCGSIGFWNGRNDD